MTDFAPPPCVEIQCCEMYQWIDRPRASQCWNERKEREAGDNWYLEEVQGIGVLVGGSGSVKKGLERMMRMSYK